MEKNYSFVLTLFLGILIFSQDALCQIPVLYVGRDDIGAYQADRDMVDSLKAWGYTPDFVGSTLFSSFTDTSGNALDYNNYDAIFIHETVDSKAVKAFGTTDEYPLPCVNMEGYAVSNSSERWAWLADAETELFQAEDLAGTDDDMILVIKDDTHYITKHYNSGDEVAWSSATETTDIEAIRPVAVQEVNEIYENTLGVIKAQEDQSGFWNFFTIEDVGGFGNKMVFWGVNAIGINGVDLDKSLGTPDFYNLTKRSCAWAYDNMVDVEKTMISHDMDLISFPNPTSDYVTVRFQMKNKASVSATLYNVTGQQVDIVRKDGQSGTNHFVLDSKKYTSGIYHLQIDTGKESAVTKIVIR